MSTAVTCVTAARAAVARAVVARAAVARAVVARLRAAGTVVALGAVLLAGCGGDTTNGLENVPAAELDDRVVSAFREADSVHVVGAVESAGRGGSSYDLRLAGESATGILVREGHEHEIVKIGAETYTRGDAEYWRSIGENDAADLLAGNWVRLSEAKAELYDDFSGEGFALAIAQYTGGLADPVTTTTLGDAAVVTAAGPDGSTLWATNTGAPYPLRLEISGSDSGLIEFSEYDAEVTITAPTDAIDLARLG